MHINGMSQCWDRSSSTSYARNNIGFHSKLEDGPQIVDLSHLRWRIIILIFWDIQQPFLCALGHESSPPYLLNGICFSLSVWLKCRLEYPYPQQSRVILRQLVIFFTITIKGNFSFLSDIHNQTFKGYKNIWFWPNFVFHLIA